MFTAKFRQFSSRYRSAAMSSLLLVAASASGYNNLHGPFPDGQGLPTIQLDEVKQIPRTDEEWTDFRRFIVKAKPELEVRVYSDEIPAHVELRVGDQVAIPKTNCGDHAFLPIVYTANLSNDGKIDFVVNLLSGGNGLASGSCNVVFLVSAGESYYLSVVHTFFPDGSDFVMVGKKRCFIQTAFETVYPCKDGELHSFWVYNLLTIDSDGIRVRTDLHRDFPKTIWYTFRRNSQETGMLTKEQKGAIQEKVLGEIFVVKKE